MKRLMFVVFVMLMVPLAAFAVGSNVGNNCTLNWTNPDPSTVDSHAVYGGQTPGARNALGNVGNVYTTTCTALGLANGQWYVVTRAVNAGGEAGDSNEFAFFLGPPAPNQNLTVGP